MSMDWEDVGTFLEDGLNIEELLKSHGGPGDERAYIASCGMYIFNREVLRRFQGGEGFVWGWATSHAGLGAGVWKRLQCVERFSLYGGDDVGELGMQVWAWQSPLASSSR